MKLSRLILLSLLVLGRIAGNAAADIRGIPEPSDYIPYLDLAMPDYATSPYDWNCEPSVDPHYPSGHYNYDVYLYVDDWADFYDSDEGSAICAFMSSQICGAEYCDPYRAYQNDGDGCIEQFHPRR